VLRVPRCWGLLNRVLQLMLRVLPYLSRTAPVRWTERHPRPTRTPTAGAAHDGDTAPPASASRRSRKTMTRANRNRRRRWRNGAMARHPETAVRSPPRHPRHRAVLGPAFRRRCVRSLGGCAGSCGTKRQPAGDRRDARRHAGTAGGRAGAASRSPATPTPSHVPAGMVRLAAVQ
jgi:hypothetical protein